MIGNAMVTRKLFVNIARMKPDHPARPATGTSIAERKSRWLDLQRPDAAPGFVFLIRCAETDRALPPAPCPLRSNRTAWMDHVLRRYDLMRQRAEWLHDDAVPYLHVLNGTEVFAEDLGSPVHVPDGERPFALAAVHDAAGAARISAPDLSATHLPWYLEFAAEARQRAGGDPVLGMFDIQSPLDIASLVWDKADLFTAMADDPAAVHGLSAEAAKLVTAFLDAWFARFGTGYVAHFPDYYMEGGLTLSEDEVGSLSPKAFRTFVQPHLAALSNRYGGIGIHCCAAARHQWDNFRAVPGLKVLNFVKPHHQGDDYILDAYRHFAGSCLQMHMCHAPQPVDLRQGTLAGTRSVIEINVDTADEARRAADRLNEYRASLTA